MRRLLRATLSRTSRSSHSLGSEGRSTATTILACRRSAACAGSETLEPRGAQAPVLHRQPPGRLAPGRATSTTSSRSACSARRCTGRRTRPATDGLDARRARRSGSSTRSPCRSSTTPSTRACEFAARSRHRAGAARRARLPRLPRPASAAGGSRRRTSSSAGCSRSTTTSLDEVCAGRGRLGRASTRRSPTATPEQRASRSRSVLLDYMRRELAIKVDYLDADCQEQLKQRSSQRLVEPWALDEDEQLEHAASLFPRPRRGASDVPRRRLPLRRAAASASSCAGRRPSPATRSSSRSTTPSRSSRDLLEALRRRRPGRAVVDEPSGDGRRARLPARRPSAMRWLAGDGTRAFHDPIRVPAPPDGRRPHQPVLRRLLPRRRRRRRRASRRASTPPRCRTTSARSARSASAQATLPVLFCSPTMELGVDIAELNVVNLRNVPPTPANYAQRTGRAGRSGQPALVFTYCSRRQPARPVLLPPARADGRRARSRRRGSTSPTRTSSAPTSTPSGSPRPAVGLGTLARRTSSTSTATTPTLAARASRCASSSTIRRASQRARRARRSGPRDDRPTSSTTPTWYADELARRRARAAPRSRFDRRLRPLARPLPRRARRSARRRHASSRDASRSPPTTRTRPSGCAREAESAARAPDRGETDSAHPVRLLQLPLLRQRGLPARLQLPAAAALGLHPRPRAARRARDEFLSAPPLPRDHASSGRAASSTTRAPATSSTRSSCRSSATEENRLADRARSSTASAAATSTRSPTATGPDLCERCGAPLDAPLDEPVPPAERRHPAPRPDHLRRGGAPAPGLRGPHRRPLRRARRARRRRDRATVERRRRRARATLTYGDAATLWRINLGWTRRDEQGPARLRARHRARLLGDRTTQASADDPDDPMSRRAAARRSRSSRTAATACSFEPARRARRRADGVARRRRSRARSRSSSSSRTTSSPPSRCPTPTTRQPAPVLRGGRGRRRCAAPARRRPGRARRGRARGAGALPLRPRHRRRPAARARRARGLRGRLLRLPALLRQPARPPAARPPRDPRPAAAARRRRRVEVVAGGAAARRAPRALLERLRTPSSSGAGSTSSTSSGYALPDARPEADRGRAARAPTSSTTTTCVAVFVDGPHHDYPDRQARDARRRPTRLRGRSATR